MIPSAVAHLAFWLLTIHGGANLNMGDFGPGPAMQEDAPLIATNFKGGDIGAQINAAETSKQCVSGCLISVPIGVYQFKTQIIISRAIHLDGELVNWQHGALYGTALNWTGGAFAPIVVNGEAGAASSTVLENFGLRNSGGGTVGIDISNGQYDVVIRNVSLDGKPFSLAGVRVGYVGPAVINFKMYNMRLGSQAIGLLLLSVNSAECYSCSIYDGANANVQVGDTAHMATSISFFGGNIEQDGASAPSVIVNNVQGLNFFGEYVEQFGGPFLIVPKMATQARGMRFRDGRIMLNRVANKAIFSLNSANSDLVIDGPFVTGIAEKTVILEKTDGGYTNVTNITSDDPNFSR